MLSKITLTLEDWQIQSDRKDDATRAAAECEIRIDYQPITTIALKSSNPFAEIPFTHDQTHLQLAFYVINDQRTPFGTISFSFDQLKEHTSITHRWISLLDPEYDTYSGNLLADDTKYPRVQLSFSSNMNNENNLFQSIQSQPSNNVNSSILAFSDVEGYTSTRWSEADTTTEDISFLNKKEFENEVTQTASHQQGEKLIQHVKEKDKQKHVITQLVELQPNGPNSSRSSTSTTTSFSTNNNNNKEVEEEMGTPLDYMALRAVLTSRDLRVKNLEASQRQSKQREQQLVQQVSVLQQALSEVKQQQFQGTPSFENHSKKSVQRYPLQSSQKENNGGESSFIAALPPTIDYYSKYREIETKFKAAEAKLVATETEQIRVVKMYELEIAELKQALQLLEEQKRLSESTVININSKIQEGENSEKIVPELETQQGLTEGFELQGEHNQSNSSEEVVSEAVEKLSTRIEDLLCELASVINERDQSKVELLANTNRMSELQESLIDFELKVKELEGQLESDKATFRLKEKAWSRELKNVIDEKEETIREMSSKLESISCELKICSESLEESIPLAGNSSQLFQESAIPCESDDIHRKEHTIILEKSSSEMESLELLRSGWNGLQEREEEFQNRMDLFNSRILEMEELNAALSNEILVLQERLADSFQERHELEAESERALRRYKDELADARSETLEFAAELQRIQQSGDAAACALENEGLACRIQVALEERSAANRKVISFSKLIDDQDIKLRLYSVELMEKNALIEENHRQIQILNEQLVLCEISLKEAAESSQSLSSRTSSARKYNNNNKNYSDHDDFDHKTALLKSLENQVNLLKDTIKVNEARLEQRDSEVARMYTLLEQRTQESEEYGRAIEESRKNAADTKAKEEAMKEERVEFHSQISTLTCQVSSFKSRITQLTCEISDINRDLSGMSIQCEEQRDLVQEKARIIASLEEEMQTLKSEVNKQLEESKEQLKAQQEQFNSISSKQQVAFEVSLNEIEKKNMLLAEQLEESQSAYSKALIDIDGTMERLKSSQEEILNNIRKDFAEEKQILLEQLAEAERVKIAECNEYSEHIMRLRDEVEIAKLDLIRASDSFEVQLHELRGDHEKQVVIYTREAVNAKNALAISKQEIEVEKEKNSRNESIVEELNLKIADLDDQRKFMVATIDELEAQIERLTEQNSIMQEEYKRRNEALLIEKQVEIDAQMEKQRTISMQAGRLEALEFQLSEVQLVNNQLIVQSMELEQAAILADQQYKQQLEIAVANATATAIAATPIACVKCQNSKEITQESQRINEIEKVKLLSRISELQDERNSFEVKYQMYYAQNVDLIQRIQEMNLSSQQSIQSHQLIQEQLQFTRDQVEAISQSLNSRDAEVLALKNALQEQIETSLESSSLERNKFLLHHAESQLASQSCQQQLANLQQQQQDLQGILVVDNDSNRNCNSCLDDEAEEEKKVLQNMIQTLTAENEELKENLGRNLDELELKNDQIQIKYEEKIQQYTSGYLAKYSHLLHHTDDYQNSHDEELLRLEDIDSKALHSLSHQQSLLSQSQLLTSQSQQSQQQQQQQQTQQQQSGQTSQQQQLVNPDYFFREYDKILRHNTQLIELNASLSQEVDELKSTLSLYSINRRFNNNNNNNNSIGNISCSPTAGSSSNYYRSQSASCRKTRGLNVSMQQLQQHSQQPQQQQSQKYQQQQQGCNSTSNSGSQIGMSSKQQQQQQTRSISLDQSVLSCQQQQQLYSSQQYQPYQQQCSPVFMNSQVVQHSQSQQSEYFSLGSMVLPAELIELSTGVAAPCASAKEERKNASQSKHTSQQQQEHKRKSSMTLRQFESEKESFSCNQSINLGNVSIGTIRGTPSAAAAAGGTSVAGTNSSSRALPPIQGSAYSTSALQFVNSCQKAHRQAAERKQSSCSAVKNSLAQLKAIAARESPFK